MKVMFDNQAAVYQAHCELLRDVAQGKEIPKPSLKLMLQNIQEHVNHQRSLIQAAIDSAESRQVCI
jgi:hypothetical protein